MPVGGGFEIPWEGMKVPRFIYLRGRGRHRRTLWTCYTDMKG